MSMPLPPELDPRGRHRGRPSAATRNLRPVGRVIGALLSVSLLVLAGYVWTQFRDLNDNVTRLSGIRPANDDTPDIDGKDQNLLVAGNDDRSNMTDAEVKELKVGRGDGSRATDVMMIIHIPADGSKATLISLPRDTEVDVPGYGRNKLNAPYALAYSEEFDKSRSATKARTAGANLLLKTVRNLTGLSFDHYVQIDLLGFYRIASALDGVEVTLCNDVDDRHSTNVANGGDGGSGLFLKKGKHTLDGLQALEFVRQRHGLDGGDFDRVKRQQYFLTAAFRKVASVGVLFQLKELGDALKKSVYFDGGLDLIDLARQVQNLTANNIVGRTIPLVSDNTTTTADPATVQKFVKNLISPPKAAPTSSKPKSVAPTSSGSTKSTAAIDAKCIN